MYSCYYYITKLRRGIEPPTTSLQVRHSTIELPKRDSPVKIRTSTKGTKNLCATVTPPENINLIIPHYLACRGIEPLVSSVKGRHLNHSTNRPYLTP